ncbi:MAG: hypothetical protein AAF721_12265 [Myxococcota bacterium]
MTHGHDNVAIDADAELSELSQELQQVEWFGDGSGLTTPTHVADHWTFEMSLVIVGALLGVSLYFWVS